MSERVIPLVDQRTAALAARVPAMPVAPTGLLTDARGRPLRDLRAAGLGAIYGIGPVRRLMMKAGLGVR